MQTYAHSVGKAIRQLRERQGISQEELAHRAAVHRTYVGAVERGERNVTVESLRKFANGLAVSPSEILSLAERREAD